jgi:phosphatidylglycerophosphate synthase
MLDAAARRLIDPPLDRAALRLAELGFSANLVTVAGFLLGLGAMAAIALDAPALGLALLLSNRLADGLDGALARRTRLTDLGGFLDIVFDFIIYSGVVFAFAVQDPERNALAAAFLVFSFVGTGASFLAFAIMAAKRQLETTARGQKSLYYLGGLTEGTETVLVLAAFCLFPVAFPWLATLFGALCWLTTASRVAQAWLALR